MVKKASEKQCRTAAPPHQVTVARLRRRSAVVREWLRLAAASVGSSDQYVLLDLQPGRSDFLSQVVLTQSPLDLSYVGLVLDPEWRLYPNQRHLVQIGFVDVAEINAAELARCLVPDWQCL
ncbi:hypothetical protein [Cryobacterium sp. Y62]|uniref:hypothetical protein n=1 Tax=Cryobacterium sp. Y62 TaxID=2048284 RepID=UPI000CE3F7D8|nr:hypothetical protein [Cryobacterium sp. Y62]